MRLKLTAARDYLAVAPAVVRIAADAPVVTAGADIVPSAPAHPRRVAELALRWNLGGLGRQALSWPPIRMRPSRRSSRI